MMMMIIIIIIDFSHPTAFVGSLLAVSQIRWVVRRIKIHFSDLSVDSSAMKILPVLISVRG
jgi:hypothetical protein